MTKHLVIVSVGSSALRGAFMVLALEQLLFLTKFESLLCTRLVIGCRCCFYRFPFPAPSRHPPCSLPCQRPVRCRSPRRQLCHGSGTVLSCILAAPGAVPAVCSTPTSGLKNLTSSSHSDAAYRVCALKKIKETNKKKKT